MELRIALASTLIALFAATRPNLAASPSFSSAIAPIVREHCVACHNPRGAAPFSLLTYADARKRAKDMAMIARKREMPPWLPEPAYGRFRGERRLSDAQIEAIAGWSAAGAPEGEIGDRPHVAEAPTGWWLGVPDMVVRMPEPWQVPADGPEAIRNFVLALELPESRWVRAVELRMDNERVVRRATVLFDGTGGSRDLDARDGGAGFGGTSLGGATAPDGHVWTWSPGTLPYDAGQEMAFRLDPGVDMVLQLHNVPTGKAETVRAEVGLYFAPGLPALRPTGLVLTSERIDIPPGIREHVVEARLQVPVDVDVLALYPRAHYLCRGMDVFATLPDSTRHWLLRIDHWDFNWGEVYRYAKPLTLPAGSTIVMRYFYDNSASNPRNPNHPPRRIVAGDLPAGEAAFLQLQVIPRRPEERTALQALQSSGNVVPAPPGQPAPTVAPPATGSDPLESAARLYAHALRRMPGDNAARFNLAGVRMRQGWFDEAAALYEEALRRDAALAEAHERLGYLRLRQRRPEEAIAHWERALRIDPASVDAHRSLGVLYARQGRRDLATAELGRVLELMPDDTQARIELRRLAEPGDADPRRMPGRMSTERPPAD